MAKPKVFLHIGKACHEVDMYEYSIERLQKRVDFRESEGRVDFILPQQEIKWVKSWKHVATCAYDATDDYLRRHLGMSLDKADRDWYNHHQLTVSAGLPMEHTLTVLSDLVEPWSVGISYVAWLSGQSLFDETRLWMECLGVNPIARNDRKTTNEQYSKLAGGLDTSEFGFEFLPEHQLQKPVVKCAGFGTSFGTGGHASYVSPRGDVRGWKLGIRFDHLSRCNYKTPVPTAEYLPTQAMELDWENLVDAGGHKLKYTSEVDGGWGSKQTRKEERRDKHHRDFAHFD